MPQWQLAWMAKRCSVIEMHLQGTAERLKSPERQRPASSLPARTELGEADFASFFDQSLDLLCIAGLDGYFKRLNPAWTARLGWKVDDLLAEPFLGFVHPGDREATLAEIEKLAGGAETILFENRYRHQNGSYRWLRWNARPVPERQQIYATARDVTRQKRLEREILEVVDRERERLGRELHDGLGQTLAGIAALGATLSRRLARSSESAASAAAAEITELLSEAISEARDLARGLAPVGLEDAGLDEALEVLSVNVSRRFPATCTIESERSLVSLDREAGLHLFRIAQEAVRNALTHGRAERIEIGLSSQGREGLLSVRDNGVGLAESAGDSIGIGLHTMAYRASLIGGSLKVRRRARRGTAVLCTFPLPGTTDGGETLEHERNDT